ncbi:MAG: glycosyltransferase family 39 protein [Planctomycetota bacterium]|nr:glycosyltransferase family 39 protein [Planctomycetota bacterium]
MAQEPPPQHESASRLSPAWRWVIIIAAMAALVWVIAARVLGPSDLWDQTQPKTIAYTTDMLVHGRWVLPRERAEDPATKPPLYNWLAAPAVALLGFSSEIGHKLPSVAAMCVGWLVLVRLGRGLFGGNGAAGELVGWLAGMMFVANYAIFKLGYLARPDMLLTLWLLLGWLAATRRLIEARGEVPLGGEDGRGGSSARGRWISLGFWLCVGLAGLTKGPAALPLLIYAILAAPLITGRWRATGALGWWWGLPLSLLIAGAWVFAVWRLDPVHLRQTLWADEIAGRVTGTGSEGAEEGPIALLTGAPNMLLYYLARFLPWSIPSIAAVVALWRRTDPGGPRHWRALGAAGAMLHGAAIFIIIVIALYTLSAGKRADYIAGAFAPGSLLAAWWMLRSGPRRGVRAPWLAPAAAVIGLAAMTVVDGRQPGAPCPDFARNINDFAAAARAELEARPLPIAFWSTGTTHLQTMLGCNEPDGKEPTLALIDRGGACWIVAGWKRQEPSTFQAWLPTHREHASITAVVRSAMMPRAAGWREQVTLFLVRPAEAMGRNDG